MSVAIAWSSKKQSIVALSSTEVEYRGVAVMICEAIWLKMLLNHLQEELSDPTTIYCKTGAKEGRFAAETGKPLGKIFRKEYILGVSVRAL